MAARLSKEHDAVWYVYELIDPRDNKPFYIGKGKGDRINHHEREATKNKWINKSKVDRIRQIWGSGNSVIKRKIALFWSEDSAYRCEAERIKENKYLTNISHGCTRNSRKISFFGLLSKIMIHRKQEDIELFVKRFPRQTLPMIEHKQLFDAVVTYGERS